MLFFFYIEGLGSGKLCVTLRILLGYIIYRGYVDENKLPHGHGVQYNSYSSLYKYKTLSIDGTMHYIGHKLRGGYWIRGKLNGQGYQYPFYPGKTGA